MSFRCHVKFSHQSLVALHVRHLSSFPAHLSPSLRHNQLNPRIANGLLVFINVHLLKYQNICDVLLYVVWEFGWGSSIHSYNGHTGSVYSDL